MVIITETFIAQLLITITCTLVGIVLERTCDACENRKKTKHRDIINDKSDTNI